MSSKIPPLLEPYLTLPVEASLILLTSVLGASTNWLILRFLHNALIGSDPSHPGGSEDGPKVVLVSFMRDSAFWKENAKRLGLDIDKFASKKRFKFVDGLGGLFFTGPGKQTATKGVEIVLGSCGLDSVSQEIHNAVDQLKGPEESKVLLIIDQLDLILAAGGDETSPTILGDMLMGLRDEVYATVISISADYPLVANQQTPLEADHAAFLLSAAHQADFIMGVRLLDSGTAKDVSGVVRITVGHNGVELEGDQELEEKELLYFVGGDGSVKVFERGQ